MKNSSDLISNTRLHIRDGTSQTTRLLPALDQEYFQLIDLRFHSLLAMVVDYAEIMKFYDVNNKAEGNWRAYFTTDETVIIAVILSTDTDKLVTLYKQHQYPAKLRSDAVSLLQDALPDENRQPLLILYFVTGILDHWLVSLSTPQSQVGRELYHLIESIIVGLGNDLYSLLQCFENVLPDEPLDTFFSETFIDLMKNMVPEGSAIPKYISIKLLDPVTLRSSFYAVVKAIEMVQVRAAELLSVSLVSRQHDPAAGLLIAFVQLFQRLHQKINRFTPNLIDFYYEQVLGAQANPFQPDYTFLVVGLSDKKQSVLIPKGATFLAGRDDDQQEVLYASEEEVCVHGASVGAIHTLFFNRDPLNSPENILQETVSLSNVSEKRRQLATECWLNTVPVHTEESVKNPDGIAAYPILGAPKITETERLSIEHARIGFVLASKALLLKEGNRSIYITLKFAESDTNSEKNLRKWIHDIAVRLRSSTDGDTETKITEAEEQDTFFKVFSNIFVIHLSGEEGWLSVDEYVPVYSGVDKQIDDNSLQIAFVLPVDAPAITSYSSKIHGERYETQLPVVRFTLNPRGYLYPYSILSKLVLDSVNIMVSANGNRTLTLHNHLGQLSSLASFNPFGPLPEVGSYFVVGCAEAAIKQLTRFSVEIEWGGLPAGIGGFRSYYHGYDSPNSHTDFKINKSVLLEGKWFPADGTSAFNDTLFQLKSKQDAASELSATRLITCDELLPYWSPADYRQAGAGLSYTPSSKKGFFKFTLTAPPVAFGHKKYPQTLARVLTHNARQRFAKMLKEEPNAPYTPVITSILANYQASARIAAGKKDASGASVNQDKLIHLHPMGWEDAVMTSGQQAFLLPQYACSGNLMIGLEAFDNGGLLTLYFHLRENALPTANNLAENLQWFYLSANQWKPLAAREIISDSTYGFMTSGIVTLNVPADITQDNTVMPDGLFWLCISADQDMEKFCSLYSIYAQAIKVTRHLKNNEKTQNLIAFSPLPAASIKQIKQSIPGLDTIWQVQPSQGGKSTENHIDMRIRMSERLRHKNRALLPIDYEQLILAHFPQIYKVKCFANLKPVYKKFKRILPCISPGHTTIVALPYPVAQVYYGKQLWLSGHLASEMMDFISRQTSTFVSVHFVNPVYETIQVRCTVKFKDGRSDGMYLGRLNEAISAYLSPWHDAVGYTTHFGWRISKHDVQSYIQELDFVDRVTNFSILRITPDGDMLFDLFDSVEASEADAQSCEITPKYPWSIAEPMHQHFIEVDNSFEPIEPQITGIGELEIGSTFIVLNRDGETK